MEERFAALFYERTTPPALLRKMAAGVVARLAVDVVEFKEPDGLKVTRELAVPFLPDMDEVVIEKAGLLLRAQPQELEAEGFAVRPVQGRPNAGFVLSLTKQSRLRKVVFDYPTFPPAVAGLPQRFRYLGVATRPSGPEAQLRLVVRPAARQGSGFSFGPPIFADPPLPAPGELYGPVLAGIAARDLGGSIEVTLPSLMGTDWLFQLASGDEPSKLSPVDFGAAVTRVTIDAAPLNVSLSILSADGGEIPLWSHPDFLLPDSGPQEVSFTPIAQNHLAARLRELQAQRGAPTLPVPLVFSSQATGALAITSKTLVARYLVRPLGPEPKTLRLGGSWTALDLSAPAAQEPEEGSARLVARHLGRELSAGSPLPPTARPSRGSRVNAERWAATCLTLAAPSAPAPTTLASARLMLEALEEAEAVVELRADAGAAPGRMLAGPLVRQLAKGFADWLEFELPAQVAPGADVERLWVCLRSNKGELLWFADGEGRASKTSSDRGQTWGDVDPLLAPAEAPLAQLFQATAEAPPAPAVALRLGDRVVAENILGGATRTAPREFTLDSFSLPAPVREALRGAAGVGRVNVGLKLFSRAALELSVERLTLFYSPFPK